MRRRGRSWLRRVGRYDQIPLKILAEGLLINTYTDDIKYSFIGLSQASTGYVFNNSTKLKC